MKRWTFVVLGILAVGSLSGVTPAFSEEPESAEKESNLAPDKGKEGAAAAVALLNQASQLVSYARENESPTAMLTAVQMLRRVRMQDGPEKSGTKTVEGMDKGDAPKAETKGKTPAPTLDPKQLLAEAKPWAKGNTHLVALLEAEAAKPHSSSGGTLGRTTGASLHKDTVQARMIDYYDVKFTGGELARVVVYGDGDTDLDLYIYDENGNLIVKDDDRSDRCVVQWTPKWTGTFRVSVSNRGKVANQYALATN